MKIAVFEGYGGARLSGFGDGPLEGELEASASAAMDETVASLRWGITKIRTKLALEGPKSAALLASGPVGWLTNLFVGTPDEVERAISSALNSYQTMTDNLDTRGRYEVLAGEEGVEKWIAGARAVADGIAGLAKDYNDTSISNAISGTIESSWIDFKERLKQLGKTLPDTDTLKWAIPLAIGGGLVVLYIGSRFLMPTINVRTNGYRRRRRAR